MPYWSALFLVIATVAALLGFSGFVGLAAGPAWLAKVLFVTFLGLALVAFVGGRRARNA